MKKILSKLSLIYPYILIGLSGLILLIRCSYSFCWSDETFYLSTCHRFFTGDSMFLHEWFPTQLSSLILLPFYSLYMLVFGSNTGIVLYFRILFVVMSLINSAVMYNILRQHISVFSSCICALMLMFYTHLNIATLSYYTISVQFFLMSMLLIYHYYKSYDSRHLLIAGILFAVSVLALPTLSIAYFALVCVIAVLIFLSSLSILPEGFKNSVGDAELKTVLFHTFIGICIPAVLFFIFLLGNVPISDFIRGIP